MPAQRNSGPAISGYDVGYRQSGSTGGYVTRSISGKSTTTDIAGLSAGTDYQVRVRAVNVDGVGPWSLPGEGRTATLGGTRLGAEAAGAASSP